MELLIALLCGVGGIVLLGACVLTPLRLRQRRILQKMSDQELSALVFRFEPRYFNYIGPGAPTVLEFQRLVEARDLPGIAARWRSLHRSFTRLERRAGYRGRPLIFDYYFWYDLAYRELMRRSRVHLRHDS